MVCTLFAQTPTVDLTGGLGSLVNVVTSFGALGVLVYLTVWFTRWYPTWYERWMSTRENEAKAQAAAATEYRLAIKDVVTGLSASIDRAAASNSAALDRASNAHAAIQDAALRTFKEESASERASAREEARAEREMCREGFDKVFGELKELKDRAEMLHKESRHEIRNVAMAADFGRRIQEGLDKLTKAGSGPDMSDDHRQPYPAAPGPKPKPQSPGSPG